MVTQITRVYQGFGRYVVRQLDASGKLVQATLNVMDDQGNLICVL